MQSYVVRRGDSIYNVARELNISVRALIDANNLQPPYLLTPGQTLALPGNAVYVVGHGDTLLGVAHKTHVPFSTLARINNLAPPYVLQLGQTLQLPGAAATAGVQPTPIHGTVAPPVSVATLSAAPTPPLSSAPAPLSQSRRTGYTPLAERETPPPPAKIEPPPASSAPPVAAPPAPAAAVAAAPAVVAPSAAVAAPPSNGLQGFVWPAKGEVIAAFGTTGKGQHNDGINIAVSLGAPVVAAESGVVAYAGNELRGFGNLLLIKHADGWMTAYAHNETLLVHRGDTVRRGQTIARAGETGGVTQPQLHFELRQGTRAVDPMAFLGKPIPDSIQADQSDPG